MICNNLDLHMNVILAIEYLDRDISSGWKPTLLCDGSGSWDTCLVLVSQSVQGVLHSSCLGNCLHDHGALRPQVLLPRS